MFEANHTCNNCDNTPKSDECFCKDCQEQFAETAYEDGKEVGAKEGYDKGYEQAVKDLARD